jgi:hypothetical protein
VGGGQGGGGARVKRRLALRGRALTGKERAGNVKDSAFSKEKVAIRRARERE